MCNLGHSVVQVQLIFRAVPYVKAQKHPIFNSFFAYVERFDIIPRNSGSANATLHYNADPATEMLGLQRSTRSNGTRMGDIIHLSSLRAAVDLVPCFQKVADARLTKETTLEYSPTFFLNDNFTKQLYCALSNH